MTLRLLRNALSSAHAHLLLCACFKLLLRRVPAVYFTGSLTKALAGYENPTGHLLGADAVLAKNA